MTRKRGRRSVLKHQINERLNELDRLGQSKSLEKRKLKESGASFGDAIPGIYSIKTKENYRQVANQFTQYCIDHKSESPRSDLDHLLKKHGKSYLIYRENNNLSVSTLSRDRAGLNKLMNSQKKIDYKFKTRSIHDIKRSRSDYNKNNKHFNEKLNYNLVALAKGTGGRRSDLAKLTPNNFFNENGRLYCNFNQSKGGKSRTVVVREEFRTQIENLISMTRPENLLFERIHSHADIHSYRRNYAQELYKDVLKDLDLNNDLRKLYGERIEPHIKSDKYITKGENDNFSGLRNDLFLITKSLGHNRLDVAVNHYLR